MQISGNGSIPISHKMDSPGFCIKMIAFYTDLWYNVNRIHKLQEGIMQNITSLKPEKVYYFFNEISKIPHGSGNTAQIAQYCLDFAAQRNLKAVKDAGDNVIIYAPGTPGYENSEPIIIQGHMDMVCEKTADCAKNMEKDGLDLRTDGEWLWAEGTTLGGDDGIALAYMFALLDSDDIPHPPIEAVITRDEETGMYGAELFEASLVKGKKILNIDSEEEGILTVSCAGGITAHYDLLLSAPITEMPYSYEISVSGLLGGHSGVDIGKGRLNAFKMLCKPLEMLTQDFCIAAITGGGKQNVIPKEAAVIIGTQDDALAALQAVIAECNAQNFGGDADPGLVFAVRTIDSTSDFYDKAATKTISDFLQNYPTGVQSMSERIEGMVETSLNVGVLRLSGEILSADFLIRSNADGGRRALMEKLEDFCTGTNASLTFNSEYPAWEYHQDSPLRDLMAEIYTDMFGKEPIVAGIHAGLECGIFTKKIEDADAISFGPDIENIHTPAERLNIASAERTWEFLKEILKRSK